MTTSVIIVTYNRLNLLKECINAVQNQIQLFNHIIIVNNASTDGTEKYLSNFKNNDKFVIYNAETNQGGAYGFKKGLEISLEKKDDWMLLIDDDAILDKEYLLHIYKSIINDNGGYEAYSGVVETEQKISLSHRSALSYRCFYKPKSIPEEEYKKPYFICDVASFCGIMISRTLVEKIGLPYSEYFILYDDSEYCLRIHKETPIKNINASRLNHKTPILINTTNWKTYYGMRNRLNLTKKHYGKLGLIITVLRIYAAMCLDIVKSLAGKIEPKTTKIVRLYHLAVKDGMKERMGRSDAYLPGSMI